MSDWQVGDLAVCVDAAPRVCECGKTHLGTTAPLGRTVEVSACGIDARFCTKYPIMRWRGGPIDGALALRFRKVRPDEHEDCEPEFVELLNRIKRKVSA
jgi:hypothetical protein